MKYFTLFQIEIRVRLTQNFRGTAEVRNSRKCNAARPNTFEQSRRNNMASSGPMVPLYGVIIRHKCKYADVTTLKAYKTVAEDLLKDYDGPDTKDLRDSLKELNAAIASKH
jgi:hypothetical protein